MRAVIARRERLLDARVAGFNGRPAWLGNGICWQDRRSQRGKGGASFPAPKDRNCTKNSRQRRHVQGDLPLRTPQRGSGKSGQSRLRASGPDNGMTPPCASLRQRLRQRTASGGLLSARLAALPPFRPIVNLCRLHRLGLGIVRLRQFPSRHAL